MARTPDDRDQDLVVTDTGWRIRGDASLLERLSPGSAAPSGMVLPGRIEDTLYAVVATVKAPDGPKAPVEWILEAIQAHFGERWRDLPALRRDAEIFQPASRFGGIAFRALDEARAWTGRLRWREVHPLTPGAPITTEVTLEERPGFTRLGVRVTADQGTPSVRGALGAGHAQPQFLEALRSRLDFTWMGAPVAPVTLPPDGMEDFIRSELESDARTLPLAVISPTEEEEEHLLELDELAFTLMGRARLRVLARHQDTFRLTDALGDRRLSAFRGAFRVYLPGFSVYDGPFEHPLLLADRLVDPIQRAALFGTLGMQVGREVTLPDVPVSLDDPSEPEAEDGPAPVATEAPSPPSAPKKEAPSTAGASGVKAPEPVRAAAPPAAVSPPAAVGPEARPGEDPDAGRAAGREAMALVLERLGQVASVLDSVARRLEGLTRGLESVAGGQERLLEELEDLRTESAVRSAGTSALERRMSGLEELISQVLEPEEDGEGEEGEASAAAKEARREPEEERYTLEDAVRDAAEAHPETLLFLPGAFGSAQESPYESPERVRAVLDAMANVAKKRRDGRLQTSLRDAFGGLNVDYRGGIAKSTPARLRTQYEFRHPDGRTIECVEHIALGSTYDPRRCLRIYFSSRVSAEPRFVIGHVGRHFEVMTST